MSVGDEGEAKVEHVKTESDQALFDALWEKCLASWDDDKPHHAILDHALRTAMLPDLAGRYRALLEDAEKGPRAKKRIDAIVVAATQMLASTKTPPRTKIPWQWNATFGLICLVIVLWVALKVLGRQH